MTLFYTRPGVTSYGHRLGIIQIDCNQPFIPGDVGNAETWPFPVLYKVAPGVTIKRLILDNEITVREPIIAAALDLQKQGVEAITSNCGYMIRHYKAVQERLEIPAFLSSLLELPRLAQSLKDDDTVAIITASGGSLKKEDLEFAGWKDSDPDPFIYGMDQYKAFREPFIEDCGVVDIDAMKKASADLANILRNNHPNLKAVLLECADLPPYASIFESITNVPVYSFYTMIMHRMKNYPDNHNLATDPLAG